MLEIFTSRSILIFVFSIILSVAFVGYLCIKNMNTKKKSTKKSTSSKKV